MQPLDPAPVVRGASPSPDQVGQRFGTATPPYTAVPAAAATGWQPTPGSFQAAPAPQSYLPVPVTLGAIQPDPQANVPAYPVYPAAPAAAPQGAVQILR